MPLEQVLQGSYFSIENPIRLFDRWVNSYRHQCRVQLNGKNLLLKWSARAERALSNKPEPLIVEMQLYFSCLVKKRVLFHDQAEFETQVVKDHLQIAFRPIEAAKCDPEEFARTFKEAHADSVTVFAKCHHGLLYYDTDRPERHPNLPRDLNLLGEQIDALHRVGIRAPIYISLQCDEYADNTHPKWRALDADNKRVKHGGAFTAGWQIMDMSSPFQDYFAEQLDEVLKTFGPIDGMFIDMCWDQPS
ncbi:MAG: alpha-L-fucosidase, partial [Proteobacteria bacterium]|nr:alpha-L-fucosidase [Pseudomonadota bacterium]